MIITPGTDLTGVTAKDLIEVPLSPRSLPARAPAEAWAHLRAYAARPDVGAIARAQPPAAFAVGAVLSDLPVLHGQACWLGTSVPVHGDARLLRSAELADRAVAALGQAHALILRGNGALTCASTPEQAVARMWLLAAACEVWLAASASGMPRPMNPGGQSSPSLDRGCGSTCGEGRRLRPRRPRRQQSDPSARLYGRLARSDGPHARRTLSSLANTRPSSVSASRL